jgi:hypothetical protein
MYQMKWLTLQRREHGRGKGDEEAVFTKASGKMVLCVKKNDKLVQATWNKGVQAAIRWQGGQTLFDSVNDKEPRSGHNKS